MTKTLTFRGGPPPQAAEVIILDFSASMSSPREKVIKAKEAACVAIDELRDGVGFALISGSHEARMLWPAEPKLVTADPWARAEAKDALRRVDPADGTAIGAWLRISGR